MGQGHVRRENSIKHRFCACVDQHLSPFSRHYVICAVSHKIVGSDEPTGTDQLLYKEEYNEKTIVKFYHGTDLVFFAVACDGAGGGIDK